MTDTKPTLAEQIEHQIGICYGTPSKYERAKLASLEELQSIKSQPVPVEPVRDEYECYDHYVDALKDYADSLQSALQVAQQDATHYRQKSDMLSDAAFESEERAEKAEAENAEQPALQVWKNKETGKHLFEWLIAPDKFSDGAKFYAIDRARSCK